MTDKFYENERFPINLTKETLKSLKLKKKRLKRSKKDKQEIKFWQQETMEVGGARYISIKGIAKAYNVDERTIQYHIEKMSLDKKWFDKVIFYKIGTLLHHPPIIDPISKWHSQIDKEELRDTIISTIKLTKKKLEQYKEAYRKMNRRERKRYNNLFRINKRDK